MKSKTLDEALNTLRDLLTRMQRDLPKVAPEAVTCGLVDDATTTILEMLADDEITECEGCSKLGDWREGDDYCPTCIEESEKELQEQRREPRS